MKQDSNAPTHVTRTGGLIATAATVTLLAAALTGTPDPTTDARPSLERPRVLGYGSGV